MNGRLNLPETDYQILSRLKALSWISIPELKQLAEHLVPINFKRPEVALYSPALASDVNILLKGIARVTYQGVRSARITVALLAPGLIPTFPSLSLGRLEFHCEAFNNCRIGTLTWKDFGRITAHSSELAVNRFHQNDLQQWYRLLLRGSGFLNLDLHERVALTLLELCSDFGVEDSRGTLLRVSLGHNDIADLVGASRPRVTEHLAALEREHLIIRQGRQMIVHAEDIRKLFA